MAGALIEDEVCTAESVLLVAQLIPRSRSSRSFMTSLAVLQQHRLCEDSNQMTR